MPLPSGPWRGGPVLLIFVAAALFLMSAAKPGLFSGVRTGVADVTAPVLSAVYQPVEKASDYVRGITGLAGLQAENARLRAENERLRRWYQAAMTLEAQNQSLQSLLNVKVEPHHRYVSARVMFDSGNAYLKSLLVRAGENDGVARGHAVLTDKGVLGRVTEAGDHTSRVLLLTDVNSRIPVAVKGKDHKAILAGNNTNIPQLDHVPAAVKLEEGDILVTSGEGGVFPFGMPVGRITSAESGSYAVTLFADPGKVRFVRIVDSSIPPGLSENNEGL